MQRGAEGIGERAKEMRHELGRELADALAVETSLPLKERAPGEVERDLCLGLVHGEQEAVAPDPALVAERLAQRRAERERAVLDGVMLIDVQIAGTGQL